MAKVIAFYNHKGGVGKTTLCHNIGYALAGLGQKVLLVDLDPQCNLSTANLPSKSKSLSKSSKRTKKDLLSTSEYENEEIEEYTVREEKYSSLQNDIKEYATSYQLFSCAEVVSNVNNAHEKTLTFTFKTIDDSVESQNRIKVKQNQETKPIKKVKVGNIAFDLLVGDMQLAVQKIFSEEYLLKENKIIETQEFFDKITSLKGLQYDIILLDLSPSFDIFNFSCLMSSDFFILPVDLSAFSLSAINMFNSGLFDTPKYHVGALPFYERFAKFMRPVDMSKLIGFIENNFTIRGELEYYEKRRVSPQLIPIAKQINESITTMANTLRKNNMLFTKEQNPEELNALFSDLFDSEPFIIGSVQDIHGFNKQAHEQGIPFIALDIPDMNKNKESMDSFLFRDDKEIIKEINELRKNAKELSKSGKTRPQALGDYIRQTETRLAIKKIARGILKVVLPDTSKPLFDTMLKQASKSVKPSNET